MGTYTGVIQKVCERRATNYFWFIYLLAIKEQSVVKDQPLPPTICLHKIGKEPACPFTVEYS